MSVRVGRLSLEEEEEENTEEEAAREGEGEREETSIEDTGWPSSQGSPSLNLNKTPEFNNKNEGL